MNVQGFLTGVTLGLWPPVPLELRSDYVQANAAEQGKMRTRHAVRHLRWARFCGGATAVLVVLAVGVSGVASGIGVPSVAYAGDVKQVSKELGDIKVVVMRSDLQQQIRAADEKMFQLELAFQEAARANRQPDTLHQARYKELSTQRDGLQKQLDQLNLRYPPPLLAQ